MSMGENQSIYKCTTQHIDIVVIKNGYHLYSSALHLQELLADQGLCHIIELHNSILYISVLLAHNKLFSSRTIKHRKMCMHLCILYRPGYDYGATVFC